MRRTRSPAAPAALLLAALLVCFFLGEAREHTLEGSHRHLSAEPGSGSEGEEAVWLQLTGLQCAAGGSAMTDATGVDGSAATSLLSSVSGLATLPQCQAACSQQSLTTEGANSATSTPPGACRAVTVTPQGDCQLLSGDCRSAEASEEGSVSAVKLPLTALPHDSPPVCAQFSDGFAGVECLSSLTDPDTAENFPIKSVRAGSPAECAAQCSELSKERLNCEADEGCMAWTYDSDPNMLYSCHLWGETCRMVSSSPGNVTSVCRMVNVAPDKALQLPSSDSPPTISFRSEQSQLWNDLPGMTCLDDAGEWIYKVSGIANIETCISQCSEGRGCNAVTFYERSGNCYLKASCLVRDALHNGDHSSARTRPPQLQWYDANGWTCMDSRGNPMATIDVSSLNDCKVECEAAGGCTAVVYHAATQSCYLEAACEVRVVSPLGQNTSSVIWREPIGVWEEKPGTSCEAEGNVLVRFSEIDSMETCKVECEVSRACTAITFHPGRAECSLSSGCPGHGQPAAAGQTSAALLEVKPLPDDGLPPLAESWVKWEDLPGHSCADEDVSLYKYRDVPSLEHCLRLCEDNSMCSAAVYSDTQRCYLHRSCKYPIARGNGDHSARISDRPLGGYVCTDFDTFEGKTCAWPVSESAGRTYPLLRTVRADNPTDCANLCTMFKSSCSDTACLGWAFNVGSSTNNCQLFQECELVDGGEVDTAGVCVRAQSMEALHQELATLIAAITPEHSRRVEEEDRAVVVKNDDPALESGPSGGSLPQRGASSGQRTGGNLACGVVLWAALSVASAMLLVGQQR